MTQRPRLSVSRRRVLVLGAVLLLIAVLPAVAQQPFRIYRARHRDAAELLPVATTALSGAGTATLDPHTHSLVLIGNDAALAATLELLDRLDVARRAVVVHVESRSLRALDAARYRVRWDVDSPALAVGRVAGAKGDPAVRVDARALRTVRDQNFSSSIRILDGEIGLIRTGRAVPVTHGGLEGATTTPFGASSGLLAQPRILADDRVELRVEPFEGHLDTAARIAFRGATTTLAVAPGEAIVLGAAAQRGGTAEERVFSARSEQDDLDEHLILIWLELE